MQRPSAVEFGFVTSRVWELFADAHAGNVRVHATIDNVFDVVWNEAQFATTSRLAGESAVTELHFTPGSPRSIQAGVAYRF